MKEPSLTPMMKQWHDCKDRAKDALLLFHLGDFYEAFHEDAKIIAKELHLTLTKRGEIPMCGVPLHASEMYIDKLLLKGHKIAIADQLEDPRQVKGIVKRDIVRIVSPGTVFSSALLQEKSSNFFVSLAQVGKRYGVAKIDLTTSAFKVLEIETDLLDELCRIQPKEILVSEKFLKDHPQFFEELKQNFSLLINPKDDQLFDHKSSIETLLSHFRIFTLDSFGLKGMTAGINAAGALLTYLEEELFLNLKGINSLEVESLSDYMAIDYTSMKNLELFDTTSLSRQNTVIDLIDLTATPMGGRLLKEWLMHPLCSLEKIHERQEAIEELLKNSKTLDLLTEDLEKVKDIERLLSKIMANYASPRDLLALSLSLEACPKLYSKVCLLLSDFFKRNLSDFSDVSPLFLTLSKALVDHPPLRVSDGNIFKDHYDSKLDELRSIRSDSHQWVLQYQESLRQSSQIKTLKIGYTNIFGYFIEVSKGQIDKVPSFFERRQTLVNGERFITKELKEFEQKVLSAEENIQILEKELFENLLNEIKRWEEKIKKIARAISEIDALLSLAKTAKKHHYVRPLVNSSDRIHIEEGKHPILDANLPLGKFIPNDTFMDTETRQMHLITGPNMAGKSTYIRQVALLCLLAQIGSFIPAKKAEIGCIDRIFTRIGASDDLSRGQSTFMVEMSETANILHHVTSRSLVILDEIGRGTSTYDGISIAWAVAEYLLNTEGKTAKTLFATHYLELTELEKSFSKVINLNVAVEESQETIVFLRKILPGVASKSYGIHVAKLAGLPFSLIQRASEILKKLENQQPLSKKRSLKTKEDEFSLFSLPPLEKTSPVEEELKTMDLNHLTPLEALHKLFSLKEKIH